LLLEARGPDIDRFFIFCFGANTVLVQVLCKNPYRKKNQKKYRVFY